MDETRGKVAWDLDKQIKDNENIRRTLLIENAKLLSSVYEHEYYKELLGDENGEWAGYLADLDIYYTRNQINSYVRVYRKLTNELKIEPNNWVGLPISRLVDCLPLLTSDNFEDWIAKINTLTSKDWLIELGQAKGKITEEDEHKHDMVTYSICRVCGKKEKHHHDSDKTSQ